MVTQIFNPFLHYIILIILMLSGPRDLQTDRSASILQSSSGQTCPCTLCTSSCWACPTPKVICPVQDPTLQKEAMKIKKFQVKEIISFFNYSVIYKDFIKLLVSGGTGSPPSLTNSSSCMQLLHVSNPIRLASGHSQHHRVSGHHLHHLPDYLMDESTTLYILPHWTRVGHPFSYHAPQVRNSRFLKSKIQVEQGGMDGKNKNVNILDCSRVLVYFYVIISWRAI